MSEIFDDDRDELDLDEDLSPELHAQMDRVRVRHGREEATHRRMARKNAVRRLIEDWEDSRSLSRDLDYL